MGRPRTADRCGDRYQRTGKRYVCQRAGGHKGPHGHGTVSWPRRILPPPPGSSIAV
jgi:hypothetical protein